MSNVVGIEATKSVITAGGVMAIVGVRAARSTAHLSDLKSRAAAIAADLTKQLMANPAHLDALTAAGKSALQVPAELRDLSMSEGLALGGHALTTAQNVARELGS